jgi:hypothetical protein
VRDTIATLSVRLNMMSIPDLSSLPEGDLERESVRYSGSRTLWSALHQEIKIQPFTTVSRLNSHLEQEAPDLVKSFARDLRNNSLGRTQKRPIHVSSDNLLSELIPSLLSLTEDEVMLGDIEISTSHSFSTENALNEIAKLINNSPGEVMLIRGESGFLYFDPAVCASKNEETRQNAKQMYHGLGRLIGLALIKGLPFPIDFPLFVFRILLGFRLGVVDLQIIYPSLVRSLATLDDESLLQYHIFFDETGNEYGGPTSTGGTLVTEHNRMRFITHVVKYFLCCQEGDERNPMYHFIVGVQNFCPRQLLTNMSPVTLQLQLEGPAAVIDMGPWKETLHLLVRNKDDRNITNMFLSAVDDMDCYHQARLFAWATGSLRGLCQFYPYRSSTVTVVDGSSVPVNISLCRLIILSKYLSVDEMKAKLRTVIRDADAEQMLTSMV